MYLNILPNNKITIKYRYLNIYNFGLYLFPIISVIWNIKNIINCDLRFFMKNTFPLLISASTSSILLVILNINIFYINNYIYIWYIFLLLSLYIAMFHFIKFSFNSNIKNLIDSFYFLIIFITILTFISNLNWGIKSIFIPFIVSSFIWNIKNQLKYAKQKNKNKK